MPVDKGDGFVEVQYVGQPWLWLLIGLLVLLAWAGFVCQVVLGIPFGNNPAPDWGVWLILCLVGIALPLFMWRLRLTTFVDEEGIHIRFFPFVSKTIRFDELKRCESRRYRPLLEYGGWGIRWSPFVGWAYTIAGNTGVQLELTSGKRILIGSDRCEELVAAVQARLSRRAR